MVDCYLLTNEMSNEMSIISFQNYDFQFKKEKTVIPTHRKKENKYRNVSDDRYDGH